MASRFGRGGGVLPVLLLLYLTTPLLSQQFEGIIDIRISMPTPDGVGQPDTTVQRSYIKPPYMRIEILGEERGLVLLSDSEKREMYVVDRALERFYRDTFEDVATEEEYIESDEIIFDMHVRDGQRVIAGYDATLLEFISRDGSGESFDRIEVWATAGLGTLFGEMLAGMQGNDIRHNSWQRTLLEYGYFPLRTRTFMGDVILEETEVVRIERQRLDPALFTIPPDYREVDLR
jgi:hypothetical protein